METVLLSPAKRVEAENAKLFEAMADGWVLGISRNEIVREARKNGIELDILETVKSPGFSLAGAAKKLRETHRLQEEVTQSQVYALTTGLITLDMAAKYKVIATCYRALAEIIPSGKSEESYFARQRGNIPQPLADNEEAPSSGMGGVLTRIKNYRFAEWIEYSKSLEDDDQTGTIRSFATDTASKMTYAEALWWVRQLYTVYQTANIRSAGGIVPNECIAGSATAGYGGPTCTPGAVSRDNIANLWEAADYVTDLEGDFMLVQITAGHFANSDKFTVKTIMQAEFNPNTPSASADVAPGIFAPNVLKGEFEMYFDQFIKYINSTSIAGGGTNRWSLGEAGKFGAFQEREALSVTMESPTAGKSLGANMRRYLVQRRFGAGVPSPEFTLVGN